MKTKNIFEAISGNLSDEVFEILLNEKGVKIERIISKGHFSPPGFWYDQKENEWIIVLKGNAELLFKDENKTILLKSGDYVNIPAHVKHRVASTSIDPETIWLAVFY